ncbi:MAG: hypothetical protein O8C65_01530 [Candidatus Methanoperedens sp.]|nr:hypothetical protein [Candidatus Methanoperedens sp.]
MVMLVPAQAPDQGIKLSIEPHVTVVSSSDHEYQANMQAESAPPGGFFFLNATIPKGYSFGLPSPGKTVIKYTWFNKMNKSKVIIYIISNNTANETVDVRFSTDSGHTYRTKRGLLMTNMVIGTTSLKFTKPTSGTPGYLNLSLGGIAGPILSHEMVKVELSKGTLTSPRVAGKYTWLLEAKNSPAGTPFTASDVVEVKKK